MWTKRLEAGRFCPTFSSDGKISMSTMEAAELALIIEGISRARADDHDGASQDDRTRVASAETFFFGR